MTEDKTKALTKPAESGFAIIDVPDAHEVMAVAFDDLGVSGFELDRLRIPAGGMTVWEVEGLEGTKHHEHLDVVIVATQAKQKAWWKVPVDEGGSGVPPDCASKDARYGIGINSLDPEAASGKHLCSECEWDKFESSRSGGKAKDCKDFAYLFCFREDSRLPSLLVVPATSLKALRKYSMMLINAGKTIWTVKTRLALVKATSGAGISYSTLSLVHQGDLPPEGQEKMGQMAREFRDRMNEFDAFDDKTADPNN
jgi:hypothetical protein